MPCDKDSDITCYKCAVDHCNNMGREDHKCKSCIATSSNSTCLNEPQTLPDTRCKAPRTLDVYCSTSIIVYRKSMNHKLYTFPITECSIHRMATPLAEHVSPQTVRFWIASVTRQPARFAPFRQREPATRLPTFRQIVASVCTVRATTAS